MNPHQSRMPMGVKPVLEGSVLVTHPVYPLSPCREAVALVLESNGSGTLGVLLNQPADPETVAAWRDLTGRSYAAGTLVHGGPRRGPVIGIYATDERDSDSFQLGVCVATGAESLDSLVNLPFDACRIALGVTTWAPGELEREIAAGQWWPVAAEQEEIFGEPASLWSTLFRRFGAETLSEVVGIRQFPDSPILN